MSEAVALPTEKDKAARVKKFILSRLLSEEVVIIGLFGPVVAFAAFVLAFMSGLAMKWIDMSCFR